MGTAGASRRPQAVKTLLLNPATTNTLHNCSVKDTKMKKKKLFAHRLECALATAIYDHYIVLNSYRIIPDVHKIATK